jgi:hypothetical protein
MSLSSQAIQEAEIRKIRVSGQPWLKKKKTCKTPSQQKKLGAGVYACYPS